MFRYKTEYYKRLVKYAEDNLGGLGVMKNVRNRNHYFKTWIGMFEEMENNIPLIDNDRNAHNKEYGKILQKVQKSFNKRNTGDIIKYIIKVSLRECLV